MKIALYVSEGNFCGIFSLDSNLLKPFWILAKSSRQVFKVALSMSTGISWRKCFFRAKKSILSASLAEFCQKKHRNQAKYPRQVSRNCILRFQWKAYGQTKFRKKIYVFSFSQFERFVFFPKKIGAVLSKLYSKCPEEIADEMVLFGNFLFFLSPSKKEPKNSGRLLKHIQQGYKKCFQLVQRKFLRKKNLYILVCFIFFRFSSEI